MKHGDSDTEKEVGGELQSEVEIVPSGPSVQDKGTENDSL